MYEIHYTNPYAFDYQNIASQWKEVDIKNPDDWQKLNLDNPKDLKKLEVALTRKMGAIVANKIFGIRQNDGIRYYWYGGLIRPCKEVWVPYIITNSCVSMEPKVLTRIKIDASPEEEMKMLRKEWHRANVPHVYEIISGRLRWAYDIEDVSA